jgi:hypothetical protein
MTKGTEVAAARKKAANSRHPEQPAGRRRGISSRE